MKRHKIPEFPPSRTIGNHIHLPPPEITAGIVIGFVLGIIATLIMCI